MNSLKATVILLYTVQYTRPEDFVMTCIPIRALCQKSVGVAGITVIFGNFTEYIRNCLMATEYIQNLYQPYITIYPRDTDEFSAQ
jgi:hypothetical protein